MGAGVVAADRDASVIFLRPTQRCSRIIQGGRKRMLRSEPVRYAQDADSRVTAENPARLIVCIEIAEDRTAAVQVESQIRSFFSGLVEAPRPWVPSTVAPECA